MDQQKKVHQRAVDNFNCKHAHYLSSGSFVVGTWVLLHETWLDSQMGHKGALRWTGPYIVHHQLHNTTYQLQELGGTVMRGSVAANCLKVFYYREEHQTVHTFQPTEYTLHTAAVSSSSAHASTVIGTLNQDLLVTPPYPVSVKSGEASFPDNRSLVSFFTITPFTFTSQSLHYRYHPIIAELEPMDYRAVQYIHYTASSSIVNSHIHKSLLESSNISDLKEWVLTTLPLLVMFKGLKTLRGTGVRV